MKRLAVIVALAIAVAGLSAVAASAGTWSWQGQVGPGIGNGNCHPWYSGQSSCTSYYGTWYQINAHQISGDTILAGFQNSSTIRGIYLYNGASGSTTPGQLSMGGSVLPGITWCTWSPCIVYDEGAWGWFEAFI